jgi:hypothetical protein
MISLPTNGNGTFSAHVTLNFHVGEQSYKLGHLGPGFALLGDAQTIDASEGEIETIVDEKVTRWKVRLTSPITPASRRFTFEPV